MDKVFLKWIDPAISSGWEPISKYDKPEFPICETVGFLLKETDAYLVVAFTHADGDVNGVLVLPRPALISMERLGWVPTPLTE